MGQTLIRYHNISPEAIAALLSGGVAVDPTNLKRDVAQTALTIANICRAAKRNMMGLVVDSFDTLDGIDRNRSSGYLHNASFGRIDGGMITSIPIQSINPAFATLFVEDNPGPGVITYYLSRDDGNTWTQVQPGVEADLSSQPPGNALRIKAELSGDAYIGGWALIWLSP